MIDYTKPNYTVDLPEEFHRCLLWLEMGMPYAAELELREWKELQHCAHAQIHDQYETLMEWIKETYDAAERKFPK